MTRRPGLSWLALAAVLALPAGCQTAGDLEAPTSPAVLSVRGKIGPAMDDTFAQLMPKPDAADRAVVYLASGGGDFEAALSIARRLAAVPHGTAVVTRECDSACVLIFLAAHERLVEPDAVLRIHRPQCILDGLIGLPCRTFWEPWASREFHDRIAHVSPRWAEYLDAQDPPAFARIGSDSVRVTGAQLIAFGAATPYSPNALKLARTP